MVWCGVKDSSARTDDKRRGGEKDKIKERKRQKDTPTALVVDERNNETYARTTHNNDNHEYL